MPGVKVVVTIPGTVAKRVKLTLGGQQDTRGGILIDHPSVSTLPFPHHVHLGGVSGKAVGISTIGRPKVDMRRNLFHPQVQHKNSKTRRNHPKKSQVDQRRNLIFHPQVQHRKLKTRNSHPKKSQVDQRRNLIFHPQVQHRKSKTRNSHHKKSTPTFTKRWKLWTTQ